MGNGVLQGVVLPLNSFKIVLNLSNAVNYNEVFFNLKWRPTKICENLSAFQIVVTSDLINVCIGTFIR